MSFQTEAAAKQDGKALRIASRKLGRLFGVQGLEWRSGLWVSGRVSGFPGCSGGSWLPAPLKGAERNTTRQAQLRCVLFGVWGPPRVLQSSKTTRHQKHRNTDTRSRMASSSRLWTLCALAKFPANLRRVRAMDPGKLRLPFKRASEMRQEVAAHSQPQDILALLHPRSCSRRGSALCFWGF